MREIISIILSVMLVAFGVATSATSETVNPSMNFVYADNVKANVAIYRSTAITSTSCATSANPLASADILTDESFVEEGAE